MKVFLSSLSLFKDFNLENPLILSLGFQIFNYELIELQILSQHNMHGWVSYPGCQQNQLPVLLAIVLNLYNKWKVRRRKHQTTPPRFDVASSTVTKGSHPWYCVVLHKWFEWVFSFVLQIRLCSISQRSRRDNWKTIWDYENFFFFNYFGSILI